MKRLLTALIFSILLGAGISSAQNANRSGVYFDLSAGSNLGKIYDIKWESGEYYRKGGVELGLGSGYRLKISRNWAWDFRLNLQVNCKVGEYNSLQVLPIGIRYTTSDFGRGQSVSFSLNTGLSWSYFMGGTTFEDNEYMYEPGFGWYLPLEATASLNLTRNLYISAVCALRGWLAGSVEDHYVNNIRPGSDADWIDNFNGCTNFFLGGRFGVRF